MGDAGELRQLPDWQMGSYVELAESQMEVGCTIC